jgi:quercetin dioxygenase-like cupin family protein
MLATEITVVSGGYSSRHSHTRCYNLFFVLRGRLRILMYTTSGPPKATILHACAAPLIVPPGVVHRFEALTPVEAREVYLPVGPHRVDPADIVRLDQGGVMSEIGIGKKMSS